MILPKILIIDDLYGRRPPNRDREYFCLRLGLKDVTGDHVAQGTLQQVGDPIAEVVFCPGQIKSSGYLENDLDGTLEFVKAGWEKWPRWALLLLDLHFKTGSIGPDGEPEGREEDIIPEKYFGLTILENLWSDPVLQEIPVIILSAMERERIERRFSEQGVLDFVDKSELTREKLGGLLITHGLLEDEKIVGHSLPFLKCLREARRRARLGNDNILIIGETGTGKELLAQYIHKQSGQTGEYITFFPHGKPENLIEDDLFGHVKGGFTGADRPKPGLAELADKGTLLIDEFGDIPTAVQAKLLRLLDKNVRETQRIGSNETGKVDLQIVMATNRMDILSSNDFRRDLLARAKVGSPIILPPLCDRTEDIPLIVDFFVRKYEKKHKAPHREISAEALRKLKAYRWPENVRQLEAVIENAVAGYRGLKYLSEHHLQIEPGEPTVFIPSTTALGGIEPAPEPSKPSEILPTSGRPGVSDKIDDLVVYLENFSFDTLDAAQLKGKLPKIEAAYARLMARYLREALKATRRATLKNPEGEIFYHPAIKLMIGDPDLKPTDAKRRIKKIFRISYEAMTPLLSDPILKEANEIAQGLRIKQQKPKKEGKE